MKEEAKSRGVSPLRLYNKSRMTGDCHVRFCERLRGEIPLCLLDPNCTLHMPRGWVTLICVGCFSVLCLDAKNQRSRLRRFWLKCNSSRAHNGSRCLRAPLALGEPSFFEFLNAKFPRPGVEWIISHCKSQTACCIFLAA